MHAQIACGNGDVQGWLALAGCDKRAQTANYALRIVNQSAHPLRARMSCASLRGAAVQAYPLDVQIAPFSMAETLLPVRLAETGPYDRAIVEVAGGDVAFSLEAPAPPRARAARWLVGFAGALVIGAAGALGAAASVPHFSVLAVPRRTLTRSSIDIPYAFTGIGHLQYALRTNDGRQIAAGMTARHAGTLHFAVPPAAGRSVVLSLELAGPFGRTDARRRIAFSRPRPAARSASAQPLPRISSFAVATPLVHAGQVLALTYATNGSDGRVWLVDETGRVWAHSAISASGTSSLKVPVAAGGHEMRAVLDLRSGSHNALSSVGVTVLPAVLSPQPTGAAAGAVPGGGVHLDLSSATAAPGDEITATITGSHGDAQVLLTDSAGTTIEQGDVPAGQSAVTLTAPSVNAAKTYYVMASISDGVAEQTLVRKLVVSPR